MSESNGKAGPGPDRLREYRLHLEAWANLLRSQAEQNYVLAQGAAEAVRLHLATWPGRAQRAEAVLELARQLRAQGDDSLSPPEGVSAERWEKHALKAAQQKTQHWLQTAAVCRLLFGCDAGKPVPTPEGPAVQATQGNPALAWGVVRELGPLVRRTAGSEFCEQWAVRPGLEGEARQLAQEVKAGLPREAVAAAVRGLLGKDGGPTPPVGGGHASSVGQECRAPLPVARGPDGREDPVQAAGVLFSVLEDLRDPGRVVREFLAKVAGADGLRWDDDMRLLLSVIDAALRAGVRQRQAAVLYLRRPDRAA
jgi:hypothetical protein